MDSPISIEVVYTLTGDGGIRGNGGSGRAALMSIGCRILLPYCFQMYELNAIAPEKTVFFTKIGSFVTMTKDFISHYTVYYSVF